jgi:predicted SnoaL-like aldol condensation-catalyzing enzyme
MLNNEKTSSRGTGFFCGPVNNLWEKCASLSITNNIFIDQSNTWQPRWPFAFLILNSKKTKMKKLFLPGLMAFLFLLSACTDNKTETSSTTVTNNADSNSIRSKAVYTAIESGDVSKVDFLADDIIDHEGPNGVRGKDSVLAMLSDMHNHFKDLKMETIADATSADGMYHFALIRMTGTPIDDKMGMPANMAVDNMSVDVVKMKDGKATEHWGFYSPADMGKMHSPMDAKMDNKMAPKMESKMDTTKK